MSLWTTVSLPSGGSCTFKSWKIGVTGISGDSEISSVDVELNVVVVVEEDLKKMDQLCIYTLQVLKSK